MKTKYFLVGGLVLFAIFLVACGSQPTPTATETAPATSGGGTVEDHASLVAALRDAGATVESGDPIEQPFFAVKGQIIKVNSMDVQTFEYETAEAMESDVAKVAPDGSSVGTNMMMWVATPHFYKSGHILVLYVGDDQTVIDLLKGTLGPQFAGR